MSMTQHEDPAGAALKLFQSANGKLITLQRINDQMSGLMAQRQRVQEELKVIKTQIDEVFEHQLRTDTPPPRAIDSSGEPANIRMPEPTRNLLEKV